MSEIKKNEELNGGVDEMFTAAFGTEAAQLDGRTGETKGRDESEADGFEGFLKLMEKAAEDKRRWGEKQLRREAKDSLMIGGVCALGVVSLIAAAVSGVWLPVAVGLGVCLSGAAGALIYRGWAVLRG